MRFFVFTLAVLLLLAQVVMGIPNAPLEERAEAKAPSKGHSDEKLWGLGGLGYRYGLGLGRLGYGGYGGFYPGWGGFGYGGYGGYGLGFLKDKKNHGKNAVHHNKNS